MAIGHLCWHLLWKCCPSTTQRRRCFNHPRSVLHQSHPFQFWAQFEVPQRTWGPSDYLATATQGCVVQGSVELRTNNSRGREDEVAARSYEGMCGALQSPMVVVVEGTSHQPHLSIVSRQRHISSVYKVDIFNGQGHILCIKIHCNIQIWKYSWILYMSPMVVMVASTTPLYCPWTEAWAEVGIQQGSGS